MARHTFTRSVRIAAPVEKVFHFHDDPANLVKITPPSISVKVLDFGKPGKGQRVRLNVTQFGFVSQDMEMLFSEYSPVSRIVDEQIRGPFASMKQTRNFSFDGAMTTMSDTFEYELPMGILGDIAHWLFVRRIIEDMFAYRQNKTKELLESAV